MSEFSLHDIDTFLDKKSIDLTDKNFRYQLYLIPS